VKKVPENFYTPVKILGIKLSRKIRSQTKVIKNLKIKIGDRLLGQKITFPNEGFGINDQISMHRVIQFDRGVLAIGAMEILECCDSTFVGLELYKSFCLDTFFKL
jgi:hypothetical protein